MANTVRVRGLLAAIGVLAVSWPCAAQVRINEISPLGEPAPWLELYVEAGTRDSPAGWTLVVGSRGEVENFNVPAQTPKFPANRHVLLVFDAPDGEIIFHDESDKRWNHGASGWSSDGVPVEPHDLPDEVGEEIHLPGGLIEEAGPDPGDGLARGGWVVIVARAESDASTREVVDAVAWGRLGDRDRIALRERILENRAAQVSLSEGFGVEDIHAALARGESIGRYPRPGNRYWDEWVRYDVNETSRGLRNRIPRPKAFTLADGAVVSSGSLSVAWAPRAGDRMYRFRLVDPNGEVALSLPLADGPRLEATGIRVAERLSPSGRYQYEVGASNGEDEEWSLWSVRGVEVVDTVCDLPQSAGGQWPPNGEHLGQWIARVVCPPGSTNCRIIDSIEPKLQRKDTHLACLVCQHCDSGACAGFWNSPQPRCGLVCWRSAPQSGCKKVCAGSLVSPNCDPCARSLSDPPAALPWFCPHGSSYCVMASVSMIASAYGKCLSQDLIAFVAHKDEKKFTEGGDLGHSHGVACEQTGPGWPEGAWCTELLRWALGIADASTRKIAFSAAPPPFVRVTSAIDQGMPVMTGTLEAIGHHMRVLAGYCVDKEPSQPLAMREWVYLYDPASGPRMETFDSWSATSGKTWFAPPIEDWGPNLVRSDEPGMWRDRDGDGLMDFDERFRFTTSEYRLDSDGTGVPDGAKDLTGLHTPPLSSLDTTCPNPTPTPTPAP